MRAACITLFEKPGYVEASEDAEKRLARGEQQARCSTCGLCRWPHEQRACPRFVHTEPRAKAREDARALMRPRGGA